MCAATLAALGVSLVQGFASGVLQSYKLNDGRKHRDINHDDKDDDEDRDISGDEDCRGVPLLSREENEKDLLRDFFMHGSSDVIYEQFDSPNESGKNYQAFGNDGLDGSDGQGHRIVGSEDFQGSRAADSPHVIQSNMMWKRNRPPFTKWFLRCAFTSLSMVFAGALIIGGISTLVIYVDIIFADMCSSFDRKWDRMPAIVQRLRVVSQMVEGWVLQLFHFITMLLVFRWSLIKQLNLLSWNLSAAFLDSTYRAVLQLFGMYGRAWMSYPLNAVFVGMMVFNSYRISKVFSSNIKGRLLLTFQLGSQFLLGTIVLYTLVYLIIPWFNELTAVNQALVAAGAPIFGAIAKAISRLAAQKVKGINHPSTSYILVAAGYCYSAIVYRLMQAELRTLSSFLVLCVVHGIVGVLERISVVIRDHFYQAFLTKCLRKRKVATYYGSFRTPRTQRLVCDITLAGILYELTALVVTNAFVQFYGLRYGISTTGQGFDNEDVLIEFTLRISAAVGLEIIFNTLGILILTWFLNIPVERVWKRNWKAMILVNLFFCCYIVVYTSQYLVTVVDAKYRIHLQNLNDTKIIQRLSNCTTSDMPFNW